MSRKILNVLFVLSFAGFAGTVPVHAQEEKSQEIKVSIEVDDGIRSTSIVIVDSDGQEQELKWTGEKVPSDIQKKLDELNIEYPLDEENLEAEEHIEKKVEKKVLRRSGDKSIEIRVDSEDADGGKGHGKEIRVSTEDDNGVQKTKITITDHDGQEETYEWSGDEAPKELIERHPDVKMQIRKKSDRRERAFLGIGMKETIEETNDNGAENKSHFITIDDVIKDSGADQAGLRNGDQLLEIDGRNVSNVNAVTELLSEKKPGDVLKIKVLRDSDEKYFDVTLGSPPEDYEILEEKVIEKKVIKKREK